MLQYITMLSISKEYIMPQDKYESISIDSTVIETVISERTRFKGNVNTDKPVAAVRYYTLDGKQVSSPSGVTLEVTTYTDGTTSTVKVVK